MTRRIVLKLLLILLAGAIINVAVAWACAYATQFDSFSETGALDDVPHAWPAYLQRLNWPPPESGILYDPPGLGIGVTIVEISGGDQGAGWERTASPEKVHVSLLMYRFGLPTRTLQCEMHAVRAGPRSLELVKVAHAASGRRAGIDMSKPGQGGMMFLPVTPLWPGFAINTIFYAAMLWILFALKGVPGAVRRRVRRNRGQCAACGYSLRQNTSETCPECGAAIGCGM